MKKGIKILIIAVSVLVVFMILKPFYVVKEGQQALVIRFGKIERVVTDTGLKWKVPLLEKITFYPTKIQSWDGSPKNEIPTLNKQFIWVDTTARWRITDPELFYKTVSTVNQAQGRMDEFIESAVKTVIARHTLQEAVRSTNDIIDDQKTLLDSVDENLVTITDGSATDVNTTESNLERIQQGRETIADEIYDQAQRQMDQFGIELIDVVILQIRYSDSLTQSVHDRMIAERRQQAEFYRSKGEGEKEFWLGKLDRERKTIISEAELEAATIKADAEAEAARIYSEAYSQDEEFYRFWKSLESYRETLPKMDKILTTDMDYFDYLYDSSVR